MHTQDLQSPVMKGLQDSKIPGLQVCRGETALCSLLRHHATLTAQRVLHESDNLPFGQSKFLIFHLGQNSATSPLGNKEENKQTTSMHVSVLIVQLCRNILKLIL